MQILATHRALFGFSTFPGSRGTRTMSEAEIVRVVEAFESTHSQWALVGAHAIGLLTEPRATADFDFVVEAGKVAAIVRELTVAFGDLGQNDIGAAIQLRSIDVDLSRSTNHALFAEALVQHQTIGEWRVPRTEVLIVLKFLAAVSPWRDRIKRRQDVVDIGAVYARRGAELDRDKAIELARLVYPGAETEFRALLDKLDRDEPIAI